MIRLCVGSCSGTAPGLHRWFVVIEPDLPFVVPIRCQKKHGLDLCKKFGVGWNGPLASPPLLELLIPSLARHLSLWMWITPSSVSMSQHLRLSSSPALRLAVLFPRLTWRFLGLCTRSYQSLPPVSWPSRNFNVDPHKNPHSEAQTFQVS